MGEILTAIWASPIYRKLILSALFVVVALATRRVLHSLVVNRLSDDSPHIYVVRKVTDYAVNAISLLVIVAIWIEHVGNLSVALGILGAGLAFALQEVIGSIAGWATVLTGRPFTIGDRIETGGIRGDVVDISVLRTTLMEIGNWLSGDHNTGRMVTVSNAFIFKEPLFNYSRHLHYVWDEIKLSVAYESDWKLATATMIAAVQQHPLYQELLPRAQEQRRAARRQFAIKITPLDPRVFVKLTDNWIELGLVYPVDTDSRRALRSDVSQRILDEFTIAGIVIASQTIAIVKFPGADGDSGAPVP